MKRKFLVFILILATLLSVAAAPMPSAANQPALASGRVKVLSPTSGQVVRPNFDGLDGKVQINNTSDTDWTKVTIQRETGNSKISDNSVDVGPVEKHKSKVVSFDITVPSKAGTYKEIWTLSVDDYLLDRFTWSFVVSGSAVKKDDHPEFSQITLTTTNSSPFSLKKNQTDADLAVTIKNVGPYPFPDLGTGYTLRWESGSKTITPYTPGCTVGTATVPCIEGLGPLDSGHSETQYIDLKAPGTAGSYSATWVVISDDIVVGRFKFTIHVQDTAWKNPLTTSYAQITVISPTSSQKYYINDPGVDVLFDIKNTGQNAWTPDFYFILTGGSNLAKDGAKKFFLGYDVAPGDTLRIAFDLKAPKKAGTYTSTYTFKNASGSSIKSFTVTTKVVSP